MAYRVEVADQVNRDVDAILGWLKSHNVGAAADAWFAGLQHGLTLAHLIDAVLLAAPPEQASTDATPITVVLNVTATLKR